jgi:hypothetical protein
MVCQTSGRYLYETQSTYDKIKTPGFLVVPSQARFNVVISRLSWESDSKTPRKHGKSDNN